MVAERRTREGSYGRPLTGSHHTTGAAYEREKDRNLVSRKRPVVAGSGTIALAVRRPDLGVRLLCRSCREERPVGAFYDPALHGQPQHASHHCPACRTDGRRPDPKRCTDAIYQERQTHMAPLDAVHARRYRAVMRAVCAEYGTTLDAIRRSGRTRPDVETRYVLYVLLGEYVGMSICDNARLTWRDHATVLSVLQHRRTCPERPCDAQDWRHCQGILDGLRDQLQQAGFAPCGRYDFASARRRALTSSVSPGQAARSEPSSR